MVFKIPIYFPCLSRWFLCAWFALVAGPTAAGVFQVTPQIQFLAFGTSSCWDGPRCQASSRFAKSNLEQSSLCPLGAGWKEMRRRRNHNGNDCVTSQELVLYWTQYRAATHRCAQGGLQARASSRKQHCVIDHHALCKNHLHYGICTGKAKCIFNYLW